MLKAELTGAQGTVGCIQLELAQSREVKEEKAATDAACLAATTAGTGRLLEQAWQLKEQSYLLFLVAFIGKVNGLAQHTARSGQRAGGSQGE